MDKITHPQNVENNGRYNNNCQYPLHSVILQADSSQLEGGGRCEVAIPVTSLGEGNN